MDNLNFAKIYSFSKLDLFDKCPKAFHFFYLDPVYSKMKGKLRKEPSNLWPFNTLGKAVHDAITLFFHLPFDKRTKESLKEQLVFSWRSEAMPQKIPPLGQWGGFTDLNQEREVYKEALQMLLNFYQVFDFKSKINYLPTDKFQRSIEDYKKLIKPLNDDWDISGKLDLIIETGKSLTVVDFKTGKSEESNNFQLKFYKLLAELNFDKPITKASFYYLKSKKIKEFDLSTLDKNEIKNEILAKIGKIGETKEFKTKPSALCKYCLYRNLCPAKKEVEKYTQVAPDKDLIDDLPF